MYWFTVMNYDIDKLKQQYIGQSYNWLTVIDVIRDDKYIKFICQCKCGNIKTIPWNKVKSGHTKSCGCYKTSNEFANNQRQYILNRPELIFNNIEKYHAWRNNNPEQVISCNEKHKQWFIDNPDKVKAQAENLSILYKEHPEKIISIIASNKRWRDNNPDKVHEQSLKHKQWHNDNKSAFSDNRKQFYIKHPERKYDFINRVRAQRTSDPDKYTKLSQQHSQWYKDNPDLVKLKTEKAREKQFDRNYLENYKDIIHPDDYIDAISHATTSIRLKCPICHEYVSHDYYSIFSKSLCGIKDEHLLICNKCSYNAYSMAENELYNYIKSIYPTEPIRNSKDIIPPYELDLYYPEKQVAIEFNGSYWHSDKFKQKQYHFNKFKLCKDKNIRLISIFEHDWYNNRSYIESILQHIFVKQEIIYARKCYISNIDYKTKSEFINKYHFYKDSQSSTISYGLYYNNELISVMSFGKLRGQNKLHSSTTHYELTRFVTKKNITIIGGASKLFRHFIKDYNPEYVLCYSDNDFFNGETYNKLGFKLKSLGEQSINYQWIKKTNVLSRYQCMPFKLLQKYPEYKYINIKGSVEDYIMRDLGYRKIYRCGNSIWEWLRT